MAIYNKRIRGGNGVNYTKEVDSPVDYSGLTNDTYFKDLSDGLVYWKDTNGDVIAIYELGGSESVVNTTYPELSTLVSTSGLTVGSWYKFQFENVHEVPNTGLANTQTPGYTPYVENLLVLATDTDKLNGFALSENNPYDIIEYDITQSTHGLSAITDNGTIIKRVDTEKQNEAPFDLRNYIVARQTVSTAGVPDTATVDRGDIIYDTTASLWKVSVRDGSDKNNFRLVDDISQFSVGAIHPTNTIQVLGEVFTGDTVWVYSQAIDNTVAGAKIGLNATNIKLSNCGYVTVKENASNITIDSGSDIEIGAFATDIIVKASSKVKIGGNCLRTMLFNANRVKIGYDTTDCYLSNSDSITIGDVCTQILVLNSDRNIVGDDSTGIFSIRQSFDNVFGTSCGAITLGNSVNNDFAADCTDTEIYSGGWNRFAQGCNVINLLGERDDAYTGGTYYSPYSEMAYNTFGVGCSNITFDTLGGRGNQFGDECKNLLFTEAGQPWRLVGTHWVRGIQNKTFTDVIHGASFIAPCQETQLAITQNDWFCQVLFNREKNISTGTYSIEIPDSKIADATDYTVEFDAFTTSVLAPSISGVTYTSGVGATKTTITSGLTAALDARVGVSASAMGDKIYMELGSYTARNTTNNLFLSATDNNVTNSEATASMTDISENYVSADAYFGYDRIDATFFTNDIQNPPVGGHRVIPYPTGHAFMWTNNGFPLAVGMSLGINKQSDPTASLNR